MRMTEVANAIGELTAEGAPYDAEALLLCHAKALELADDGMQQGVIGPIESAALSLTWTDMVRQAAEAHGDLVHVALLAQLQKAHQTILDMVRQSDSVVTAAKAPSARRGEKAEVGFLVDDGLSHWTRKLAVTISFPSMQFDTRPGVQGDNPNLRAASRLYWYILGGNRDYELLRLTASSIEEDGAVLGCVVFLQMPGMAMREIHVRGEDYTPVIEALDQVVSSLPRWMQMATTETMPRPGRNGVDHRRLHEMGRLFREARTGNALTPLT
jgi:hypothetical protein